MQKSGLPIVLLLVAAAASACASHSANSPSMPTGRDVIPQVVQTPSTTPNWEFFGHGGHNTAGLAIGWDRNVWFTDASGVIGTVTIQGVMTQYQLSGHEPTSIVRGPLDSMWFADANFIGRITMSGAVTEYQLPIPNEVTTFVMIGPDKNVWFLETQPDGSSPAIGRINSNGKFLASFDIPHDARAMTVGGDGNVWFDQTDGELRGISPTTGKVVINCDIGTQPLDVTTGPDGNVWFTTADAIGYCTPSGETNLFEEPDSLGIQDIVAGPDDHMWFTTSGTSYIGRATLTGTSQWFKDPNGQQEYPLIVGPDRNIWFGYWQTVGVYIREVMTVVPQSIGFGAVGDTQTVTVSEKWYHGTLTAESENSAVATVAPASANSFLVSATGPGSTSINILDKSGNEFSVGVTVP